MKKKSAFLLSVLFSFNACAENLPRKGMFFIADHALARSNIDPNSEEAKFAKAYSYEALFGNNDKAMGMLKDKLAKDFPAHQGKGLLSPKERIEKTPCGLATQGIIPASYSCGYNLFYGQNGYPVRRTDGFSLMKYAANNGHKKAYYYMAHMYNYKFHYHGDFSQSRFSRKKGVTGGGSKDVTDLYAAKQWLERSPTKNTKKERALYEHILTSIKLEKMKIGDEYPIFPEHRFDRQFHIGSGVFTATSRDEYAVNKVGEYASGVNFRIIGGDLHYVLRKPEAFPKYTYRVDAVAFMDLNSNGLKDIVVIGMEQVYAIGEWQKPSRQNWVYLAKRGGFVTSESLSREFGSFSTFSEVKRHAQNTPQSLRLAGALYYGNHIR